MKTRIAWIEDDTHIIYPVVEPLEESGFKFTKYGTARDALDAATEIKDHALLLLDMIIPSGDPDLKLGRFPGLGVLRRLVSDYDLAIPVIALTVVREEPVLEELHRLGVVKILHKPVLPSVLMREVEEALAGASRSD